ncbi:thymopoietin isoform X2 [Pseudophryne corroboree]|uniref:thymopoietin isoform X2 n=1 Tax=Pseudophryne corroboree TaxID=495146 RepID=UPI0030813F98
MAELPRDPSSLTKEELKSELVANNVALPPGEQRKNVYVKLYREVLAARSRGTPDFSSDEERSERKSTPMRGRGRPPGRKATKKTDKPSEEEKIEPDVTELGNDALREELLKYGIKPGPILGSTRKVYEQRLLKIKEQQLTSMTPSVADFPIADNNKQNGNTDSRQYSDNEDPKIELTLETREPLRGKLKAQVSSRSKRPEENETADDTEFMSELNVKRKSMLPPKKFLTEIEDLSIDLINTSEDAVSDPPRILEPEKSGRLQAVSKESTRVARRTPRKRVVTAGSLAFDDDADISETAPVTETILPSSNQTLSRQVGNQVTESFKHTNALRSVSELTDLSRRTPKKQLLSENYLNLLQHMDADSLRKVTDVHIIGHTNSSDLLNTALIEDTGDINGDYMETPKKTRQLKITKFVTPLKRQIIEKTFEEKRENKDILKEMFPYEMLTPTGISASCRRPIKGAAGRPLSLKDLEMEERYSSKYVSKYQPVVDVKAPKMKTGRSVPIWLKILFLVIVAVLSFLVYQAMETNEGNPFSKLLQGKQNLNEDEN